MQERTDAQMPRVGMVIVEGERVSEVTADWTLTTGGRDRKGGRQPLERKKGGSPQVLNKP